LQLIGRGTDGTFRVAAERMASGVCISSRSLIIEPIFDGDSDILGGGRRCCLRLRLNSCDPTQLVVHDQRFCIEHPSILRIRLQPSSGGLRFLECYSNSSGTLICGTYTRDTDKDYWIDLLCRAKGGGERNLMTRHPPTHSVDGCCVTEASLGGSPEDTLHRIGSRRGRKSEEIHSGRRRYFQMMRAELWKYCRKRATRK